MTVLVMSALARPAAEPRLPAWVEPRYYSDTAEMLELAPQAEIGWFDMQDKAAMGKAIALATKLKWLYSIYTGVDSFPLDQLRERGVVLTNGAGIAAVNIAEWVVLGMLSVAKGYADVVRGQDRHEWLAKPPGVMELAGSRALILGYGTIGQRVETLLSGFGVDVSKVRRSPGENTLAPGEWRARLGEFDWVIVAVPGTAETEAMLGAAEFAAMKRSACLINIARGSVIDQPALVAALNDGTIGSAFLDVTTPEPLSADDPLWSARNVQISMHLSGRSYTGIFGSGVDRLLENLARFHAGEPMRWVVDYDRGY